MEKSTQDKRAGRKSKLPQVYQFVSLVCVECSIPDSVEEIEEYALRIIEGLKLTVIRKSAYTYQPTGITLVYILSQSHLVIHTWPEYRCLHIDLVSCIPLNNIKVKRVLRMSFQPLGICRFLFLSQGIGEKVYQHD